MQIDNKEPNLYPCISSEQPHHSPVFLQIDNEDLTFSLETVIERFAADMAPYAAGLCQQLAQQFWRITSSAEGAGGEDGEGDADGGDDGECGYRNALVQPCGSGCTGLGCWKATRKGVKCAWGIGGQS
jgi:hypothetical protein